jgi:flavin-binding protein dodecin
MSVAKVTEISCSSPKSFEDAIEQGIERADKTLDKVKGAWVSEMKVEVEDGKVSAYRVNLKVTFVLNGRVLPWSHPIFSVPCCSSSVAAASAK